MSTLREATTRVVVIDDAITTRARLEDLFSEVPGVSVAGCHADRRVALRMCSKFAPRCVVIDVPLRNPSGLDLLATLRREVPNCTLIVLTNQVTESIAQRMETLGVDHFLGKITDFERAIAIVRSLALAS
jgi:DNA-binding NarL/FixJ family response regulator